MPPLGGYNEQEKEIVIEKIHVCDGGGIMPKRLPKGFCANVTVEPSKQRKTGLSPFNFSKEVLEGKRKVTARFAIRIV